jgi:hypothetical protein
VRWLVAWESISVSLIAAARYFQAHCIHFQQRNCQQRQKLLPS